MSTDCQTENPELLSAIKNGDNRALDILVEQNIPLVKKIASRFVGRGTDFEDLVQIGVIGMIKAARSFDFGYGTVFSTYAVPLIMGEIRRFLRDDGPVKVSRSVKKNGITLMQAKEDFLKLNGREPRLTELSEITGIPAEEIPLSLDALSGVVSINQPTGDDDASLTVENTLSDEGITLDSITDKLALYQAIKSLPGLWRKIILLRYFKDLSQSETGKMLGITQVKVSREEQKILTHLKKILA